jgi:hypothetical protein
MKHPAEMELALLAGDDLGWLKSWRISRHLRGCEQCSRQVAEFADLRSQIPDLNQMPDVSWPQLAAEMRANIRLGLEAGSCVGQLTQPRLVTPRFAMAASAALAGVVLFGLWLQPSPPSRGAVESQVAVLEATGNGISLKQGGGMLSLMHSGSDAVTLTVSVQGAMRARWVDADTGNVTINNVYVQ